MFASVPGAGGDDAIFILGQATNSNDLANTIKDSSFMKQNPNLAVLPVSLLRGKALDINPSHN